MHTNVKYLLAVVLFVFSCPLFAQTPVSGYEFTYDAAGNRVKREYKTVMIKQGADKEIKQTLADFEISVFPNPTTSYVDIKLGNLGRDSKAGIRVIDLAGREIFSSGEAGDLTRIDLHEYPNGVYLMEITIDGKTSDWKIVKQE